MNLKVDTNCFDDRVGVGLILIHFFIHQTYFKHIITDPHKINYHKCHCCVVK